MEMQSAALARGLDVRTWLEQVATAALRRHEQPAMDPAWEPGAGGVWQALAPPALAEAPNGIGWSLPVGFGAAEIEHQIQAVISDLRAQAAACTRSPPAPGSAGWKVPDWRDGTAYPAFGEMSLLWWRWEFFRRHHGYRQDWLRAPEEFRPCPRERYFEEIYEVIGPVDPRLSLSDMPTAGRRSESQDADSVLRFLPDERSPFVDGLFSKRVADFWQLHRIIRLPPSPADLYLRLNLFRDPVKEIDELIGYLKELRKEFLDGQVNQERRQEALWPLYLRLLDAEDADAPGKERAAILPAHKVRDEQGLRDSLRSANRLRGKWSY